MYTQIIQKPANLTNPAFDFCMSSLNFTKKPANLGLITQQIDTNYLGLGRISIKFAAFDFLFNGKPALQLE